MKNLTMASKLIGFFFFLDMVPLPLQELTKA
jgi:hypothetical protein